MNKPFFALAAIAVASASMPAWADLALATSKNCMACHATDKKLVGPAYKDVAAKYSGDKTAADKLATKIQKGGGAFNEDKLDWMNKEHIKGLPKENVREEITNLKQLEQSAFRLAQRLNDLIQNTVFLSS